MIVLLQDGVWFGDDGTLRDEVKKGSSADDKIFLEAEKYGFDIRSTLASTDNPRDIKFSFFGDETFPEIDEETEGHAQTESNESEPTGVHVQSIVNDSDDVIDPFDNCFALFQTATEIADKFKRQR